MVVNAKITGRVLFKAFLVIALVVAASSAVALEDVGDFRGESDMHEFDLEDYDFKEWKEGQIEIPDYPDGDDLMKFEGPANAGHYRFYIDEKSLSLADDGIVRYMVLIKSKSGSSNVFYEGLRCTTREFKTYAYGVKADKPYMHPKQAPQWERIENSFGTMGYRNGLHQFYFCGPQDTPLDFSQIKRNLKYGAETRDY